MRAILGAYRGGGRGPGAAGQFLNHPRPHELLLPSVDRPNTATTIGAIRQHYDDQLMVLGFKKPARRTINFPADNPYYDILLASRHDTGVDLWNRTNPVPVDPQMTFSWVTKATVRTSPTDHRSAGVAAQSRASAESPTTSGMSRRFSPAVSTSTVRHA